MADSLPLIAIAGNPNTGKSTLFNQLTGHRARVGNYPGITVDRHMGQVTLPGGARVEVMDVPGTYSLAARSAEEQLAIQAIAGLHPLERPDAVVVVADATQLARNLYLILQVIELGQPVVVALNMMDQLTEGGEEIDVELVSVALGVPVVPIIAQKGEGLEQLKRAMEQSLGQSTDCLQAGNWFPDRSDLVADIDAVGAHIPETWAEGCPGRRAALAQWAMLSLDPDDELNAPRALRTAVEERRRQAEQAGRSIEEEIIRVRYAWIDRLVERTLHRKQAKQVTLTDKIDRVLLHPALGFVIFLSLMTVVFQSLFAWADPAIGMIEAAVSWLGTAVGSLLPGGLLSEFIVAGVIEGVGSVLVFLPQILLLFFFIAVLEDSGYMSRVAFLMDRIMKAVGLHGRAFVPMLSGFACAVPAIMATRTMERRRDRLLTMMVVPLMTCSARLPVYGLLIAALYPPDHSEPFVQGLMMVAMYLFSTLLALICAAVLGKTLIKGPRVPLLLEMPPYRMPHWPSVLRTMAEKCGIFVKEAGTIILACTIGMWLLLSFPRNPTLDEDYAALRSQAESELQGAPLDQRLAELHSQERGALLRASYAGHLGRAMEPAIEPIGFDWKIGVGLIGAFAAREVFVSTMAVVYGLEEDTGEDSLSLRERIREQQRPDGTAVYTPLTCISLMVFFALACQCMSTLAAVRRESASWRWPAFLFGYMTVLAWLASWIVYQGGQLLGFE